MGEKTNIAWCDHTFNPWIGCQKVSAGCDNCYAETLMDKRYHRVEWGPHGERVRTSEANWKLPYRWAKAARGRLEDFETGMLTLKPARPRVFCASLADVWDKQVPHEWRIQLFQLIKDTPELDWLLLTKRPENICKLSLWAFGAAIIWRIHFPNVWLGFTAEDQEHFDRRWRIMREIQAVVRFCSYEPAIGPLRLWKEPDGYNYVAGLNWLICGGESGPGHRPMNMCWEEDIRRDCARAGISYFFKQMAGKRPIPYAMKVVREFPRC